MTDLNAKCLEIEDIDPNHVIVQIVDRVTFHSKIGDMLGVTLSTITPIPNSNGKFVYKAVVAARIRFDLSMARAIVQGLGQQIASVDALEKQARSMPVEEEQFVN